MLRNSWPIAASLAMMRFSVIAAALSAVLAALGASSAIADILIQQVSRHRTFYPQLAIGPGGGLLAWRSGDRVLTLRLDADGRPAGRPRAIAGTGDLRVVVLDVAVDLDGNAVVAGSHFISDRTRCCTQIWAALVPRHGPVGRAQPLSVAGMDVPSVWRLAIGGGRAVAAWYTDFGTEMAATTAGHFSAPRPLLDPGRSIADALVSPGGTAEILAIDGVGHLQQVSWPRTDRLRVRPVEQIRLASTYDAPYVVSGLDGTRVAIEMRNASPVSARIAPPGRPWSPATTVVAPTNALLGVGPTGDAAIADVWHNRLRVRWRRGNSFAPAQRLKAQPRAPQGFVVGEGIAALSWSARQRQPGAIVAIVRRDAGVRTRRFELAHWTSPVLALGARSVVVAAQTRRGLELLRFPQ